MLGGAQAKMLTTLTFVVSLRLSALLDKWWAKQVRVVPWPAPAPASVGVGP